MKGAGQVGWREKAPGRGNRMGKGALGAELGAFEELSKEQAGWSVRQGRGGRGCRVRLEGPAGSHALHPVPIWLILGLQEGGNTKAVDGRARHKAKKT